jgi:hypothetical protein
VDMYNNTMVYLADQLKVAHVGALCKNDLLYDPLLLMTSSKLIVIISGICFFSKACCKRVSKSDKDQQVPLHKLFLFPHKRYRPCVHNQTQSTVLLWPDMGCYWHVVPTQRQPWMMLLGVTHTSRVVTVTSAFNVLCKKKSINITVRQGMETPRTVVTTWRDTCTTRVSSIAERKL